MEIGRIEGATRMLGAPADWNAERDGPCLGLPIRDEMRGDLLHMTSAWFPTAAELALLQAGAPVHLVVIGAGHPPVWVGVGEASKAAGQRRPVGSPDVLLG